MKNDFLAEEQNIFMKKTRSNCKLFRASYLSRKSEKSLDKSWHNPAKIVLKPSHVSRYSCFAHKS